MEVLGLRCYHWHVDCTRPLRENLSTGTTNVEYKGVALKMELNKAMLIGMMVAAAADVVIAVGVWMLVI